MLPSRTPAACVAPPSDGEIGLVRQFVPAWPIGYPGGDSHHPIDALHPMFSLEPPGGLLKPGYSSRCLGSFLKPLGIPLMLEGAGIDMPLDRASVVEGA
jgi:hypothetical protein